MAFESEKKIYLEKLYKPDFSKKGSVDEKIKDLIEKINSNPDYYTTSSCSGRIMLITIPDPKRKDTTDWLFVSHKKIQFKQLPLTEFPKSTTWFRQESMILHVCCKDLNSAQDLVDKAKTIGFKRSGIMATKNRIMVEMMGTEKIDLPITKNGKLVVTKDYLTYVTAEANKKMKINHDKIKKFYKLL